MIFTKQKSKKPNLEKEIDKLIEELGRTQMITNDQDAAKPKKLTEEYDIKLTVVERLSKLKDKKEGINWAPWVVGGVALIQTFAILKHEKIDIIASKALGFVVKGRV